MSNDKRFAITDAAGSERWQRIQRPKFPALAKSLTAVEARLNDFDVHSSLWHIEYSTLPKPATLEWENKEAVCSNDHVGPIRMKVQGDHGKRLGLQH